MVTADERNQRLAQLRVKREASLHLGKPMTGYKERVEAIDREIARLEAEDA